MICGNSLSLCFDFMTVARCKIITTSVSTDPEKASAREAAREAARQRMQEQLDAQAARHAEQLKQVGQIYRNKTGINLHSNSNIN